MLGVRKRVQRIVAAALLTAVWMSPAFARPQLRVGTGFDLPDVVGRDVTQEAAAGDTLFTLARAAGLGLEHVAAASGLPLRIDIPEGTVVTLPTRHILPVAPPVDGLVLNVPERGLYLFRGGRFHAFFAVAVGRVDFPTPSGRFRVIERVRNPTWFPPQWSTDRRPVPPGSDNPLGDRWIGTSATRVGIHGTQSPMSIGMCVSHGCVRMYPESVRRLFDLVSVGTPVRFDYETAKLGVDHRTGRVYLATFPDVYRRADPYQSALRLLRRAGLLGRVSRQEVRARTVRAFCSVPLFGADFVASVDGRPVALEFDPLVRGRTLWLPVSFARALGATASPRGENAIILSRAQRSLLLRVRPGAPLPADGDDATHADGEGGAGERGDGALEAVTSAYRLHGHLVVPATALLEAFAASYAWRVGEHRLDVTTPPAASVDAP